MSQSVRHVEVIYCDDIRQEIGQKHSYMGVYSGDMVISNFPAVLPKLCIAVTVVTPIDDPIETLQINIFQDGIDGPIISTEKITAPAPNLEKDDSTLLMAHFMFSLSPFQIEKESKLRVEAETERGPIKGRGLRLIAASNSEVPIAAEGSAALH